MNRRPGLTLTEALVALFVAALGMIAILTLFPLGALQMGQALKDSRTSQSAQEADGLMRWYWSKYETNPAANSPIMLALDHGDYPTNTQFLNTTPPVFPWLQSTDHLPSYPVIVDPLGYSSFTTWPNGQPQPPPLSQGGTSPARFQQTCIARMPWVPRRTVSQLLSGPSNYTDLLTTQGQLLRFSTLQDELTYDTTQRTGAPASGSFVERGVRYNWMWVLQRPDNSRRGNINMTVLVFDQRPPFFANSQTETPIHSSAFQSSLVVNFTPGSTSLTIYYGKNPRPSITKGRWVMDATGWYGGVDLLGQSKPIFQQALRNAYFYRVASVNDEVPQVLSVELETPIRPCNNGGPTGYPGTLVVLKGLAEVFERPPLVTGDATATPGGAATGTN